MGKFLTLHCWVLSRTRIWYQHEQVLRDLTSDNHMLNFYLPSGHGSITESKFTNRDSFRRSNRNNQCLHCFIYKINCSIFFLLCGWLRHRQGISLSSSSECRLVASARQEGLSFRHHCLGLGDWIFHFWNCCLKACKSCKFVSCHGHCGWRNWRGLLPWWSEWKSTLYAANFMRLLDCPNNCGITHC